MRIIYICNEYPPATHGGIGIFTRNICEFLASEGFDIMVVGYDDKVNEDTFEEANGVKIRRLKNPWPSYKLFRIGRFHISLAPLLKRRYLSKKLEKLIIEFRPDLVESYEWSGPLLYKPSATTIVRLHGSKSVNDRMQGSPKSILTYIFEKRNVMFADHLISISKFIGRSTQEVFSKKLEYSIIGNSIDLNLFKPDLSISKKNQLLFVGRLHPVKGIENMLNAMELVWSEKPNLVLKIVGNGSSEYRRILESRLRGSNKNRVNFIGFIPHHVLAAIYSESLALLMPSKSEAFGLTAIEAITCGTYVLGSNNGSLPELLNDSRYGKCINYDDPEEAAKEILEFVSKPVFPETKSDLSMSFSNQSVLQKNIEFYKTCLN